MPAAEDPMAKKQIETVAVRPLTRADISDAVKLQRKSGAWYTPWTPGQLESHVRNFPAGQLLAEDGKGNLVGMCSSLILAGEPCWDTLDWVRVTGNGFFHTHRAGGDTLFVADISIAPDADRPSARAALDGALIELATARALARVMTASRLPGYPAVAAKLSPEAYLDRVAAGEVSEPVLGFLLAQGFRLEGLLPDLQNQPRDAQHLATRLVWRAGEAAAATAA